MWIWLLCFISPGNVGFFHYWGEAGAASLRAVIPVAVLGKMDRRISNIHIFFQEKQRNKHCLCTIKSRRVACLIIRYIMDNSRRMTFCYLCRSLGKRKKSSRFTMPLVFSHFCSSGPNLASVNEMPPCCATVFPCFTNQKCHVSQRQSCWLGFLDRASSGFSSSQVFGRCLEDNCYMFSLFLVKYIYWI